MMESTQETPAVAPDTLPMEERVMLQEMQMQLAEHAKFIAPVCHVGTQRQLCALYAALAAAQGEFEPIAKNRTGLITYRDKQTGIVTGSYELRYADLEEVTAKTRPALSKHGLLTIQPVGPAKTGGGLSLFTQLVHADGGMLMSEIPLGIDARANVQDLGAMISYIRRYAKVSILDVSADDDQDQGSERFSQSPGSEDPRTPRAGQVTRQPAEQADKPEQAKPAVASGDNFYTQEHFEKNLPGYIAAMQQGKSADYIIKVSTTKRQLTDDMIQTIRSHEPKPE